MSQKVTIKAVIRRNYGRDSVEFGLDREIEVEKNSEVVEAYNRLVVLLQFQIEDYEKNHLPQMPVPPKMGIAGDTKPPAAQWYKALKIKVNVTGGKAFYYIVPDKKEWSKFGAGLYFDRCKDLTEAQVKEMLNGNFAMDLDPDMRVLIEVYQGKPRAIGFRHKDEIGG